MNILFEKEFLKKTRTITGFFSIRNNFLISIYNLIIYVNNQMKYNTEQIFFLNYFILQNIEYFILIPQIFHWNIMEIFHFRNIKMYILIVKGVFIYFIPQTHMEYSILIPGIFHWNIKNILLEYWKYSIHISGILKCSTIEILF